MTSRDWYPLEHHLGGVGFNLKGRKQWCSWRCHQPVIVMLLVHWYEEVSLSWGNFAAMATLYRFKLDRIHWFQEVHILILLTLVQLPEENDALISVFLNCRWNLSLANSCNSPHAVHLQETGTLLLQQLRGSGVWRL